MGASALCHTKHTSGHAFIADCWCECALNVMVALFFFFSALFVPSGSASNRLPVLE